MHNFAGTDPIMGTEKNFFRLKFKTAVNMIPQVEPFVGLAKLRLRSFEDVGIIGGEIDFIIYFNYDKINRDRKISSIKLVNNNSYSFMTADDINSLKVNIDVYIDTSNFNIIDIYMLNPSNVSDKESPQCHMHKFEYELEAVSSLENTYTFGDSENENIFVNLIPEELKNGNILVPGSMSPGFKYNTSKPGLNYIEEVTKGTIAGFKNLEFVRFNEAGDSIVRSVNTNGEFGDEIIIKRGLRGYTGDTLNKPDKPEPPFNVPYGTIVEWPKGAALPSGWIYTLGGKINKSQYEHLSNVLQLSTEVNRNFTSIINSRSIDDFSAYIAKKFNDNDYSAMYSRSAIENFYDRNNIISGSGLNSTRRNSILRISGNSNLGGGFVQSDSGDFSTIFSYIDPYISYQNTSFAEEYTGINLKYIVDSSTEKAFPDLSIFKDRVEQIRFLGWNKEYNTNKYDDLEKAEPSSVAFEQLISKNVEFSFFRKKSMPLVKLGYIKINATNATGSFDDTYVNNWKYNVGNIDINDTSSAYWNKILQDGIHNDINWYLVIETWDDNVGDFIRVAYLHNKTDFIKFDSDKYIHIFENNINITHMKMYIDFDRSEYNVDIKPRIDSFFTKGIFIGGLELGIYKPETVVADYLEVPFEQDVNGNPKIIYIGQPIEQNK